MKQTAVEWLISQILAASINKETEEMHITLPKGVFEQAKEMEKEQIVDAFSDGTRMIDVNDEMSAMLNGFIYYGENYEQDQQR